MKKKRFYNNKRRGEKWTEPEIGRSIDFADKYVEPKTASADEYYHKSRKKKRFSLEKDSARRGVRRIFMALGCILVVAAGYIIMDVCMEMRSMPAQPEETVDGGVISEMHLEAKGRQVDSLSLDGAVMLDAVIDDISADGYSAVVFDLKRPDGTIGYNSSLATIASVGAVSSPASDLKTSAEKLKANDVLAIGRIACYRDNVLTSASPALALKDGDAVYKDADGNGYLNPDSEEVYQYIKGIVEEAAGMGISVFILDQTDLPEPLGNQHRDGFDALSARLTADLGTEIKYLKPIQATLTSADTDGLKKEAEEKLPVQQKQNEIYSVACSDQNRQAVKEVLDDSGFTCYVIAE